MNRRIPVFTGVGVVSPYGIGLQSFVKGLERGESCAKIIQQFDASTFPTTIAAEVPITKLTYDWMIENTNPTPVQERLLAKWFKAGWFIDRKIGFALIAAQQAWSMARGSVELAKTTWNTIALGLEQGLLPNFDDTLHERGIDWATEHQLGQHLQPDQYRLRTPVDLAQDAIQQWFQFQAPSATHVSACAAGGMSIAHAASLIQRGLADIVLCGGADAMINPLGLGGMSRLGAPSPRQSADACRPFDLHRDGLLMGEGGAIFVMESLAHAQKRAVKPIAIIKGWATTQDGWRTTAPHPEGKYAAKTMQLALQKGNLHPSDIQYINAHGTGTPLNDVAESKAIHKTFGKHAPQILVSSTKGAIGHWMAASGAVEAAASLLPLTHALIPMTTNLVVPDPACALNFVMNTPQKKPLLRTLSNSFGFGGQNVSLIFQRYPS